MSTVEIYIPDEMASTILQFSSNKQSFVIEAIKERLEKMKKRNLEKTLTEGYTYSAKEDANLINDFKHIDLENWDEY